MYKQCTNFQVNISKDPSCEKAPSGVSEVGGNWGAIQPSLRKFTLENSLYVVSKVLCNSGQNCMGCYITLVM